ncbi:MAG: ATP-dependent Clp protease ATP-binding subunit [Phaeodactylibacter sp.]|nr:ATP-dependent Clp protease ATP-binding subunit [Phaeodactylibacter sp.]MCB9277154.1 ATP-dependent Clp protease ATP-binding subunit [Lewinellaceae bacterium]
MATVKLKIPTIIKDAEVEGKTHYYLRPLFTNHPVAAHRRYSQAATQFQKEVRQLFKGYSLSRQSAAQLLWLMFNPELQYRQYDLDFNLGRQFVSGPFAVVTFKLKNQLFACLPGFNNFMFMLAPGAESLTDIGQESRRVIQHLLRKYRQEQQGDFKPEAFFASKREFITTIEVPANIGLAPFSFDAQPNNWLFTSLMGDTVFDGGLEAERTGQDLNALYPAGLNRAYYQEELVNQAYHILFHKANSPLAIIGPEGVGKHTLVHEAIWRYESGHYEPLKGRRQRVWHIDPTRIIAGMSIVGMWQKRFESILSFILKPADNAKTSDKLLIDNPVALLRIGKSAQNNMTLSDVLRPYLEKRQLQLILLATPEEWKVLQEKSRRFSNLFQVIRLDEPGPEAATKIILQKRRALERDHDCIITIQAVQQLMAIQRNYLRNKPLPGSVIKLMQQLAVKYRYSQANAPEVRDEFRAFSGLEERIFDSSQPLDEQDVQELIGRELVGQPQAVSALADIVHIIKAKLADKDRPLASFLFIGPTGVGKTQAAKVLAQYLMGSDAHLIRFDMNEYIDAGALQRLIGDDYNPEGQLAGAVRYRPFGVILLDEIEKAHPLVLDLLLQLLDDGRLADSLGRTVDFTNTIIIMTSNVGASQAASRLGYIESAQQEADTYRRALENEFRPEFINRIGQVVIFGPLGLEHILDIARLQIRALLQRDGFVRRATILNISPDALEWVARRGFDARLGGRALRRQIERDLTTLSAEQLITTDPEVPILFDILLKGERLSPRIRPLDFVSPAEDEWLPQLPEESKGKGFYNRLLQSLANLKAMLDEYEEQWGGHSQPLVYAGGEASGGLGWQYYQLKDKVEEARAAIRDISLGFRDRNYKYRPAIPYRLKPTGLTPKKDWSAKGVRENLKDRLFQEEGLSEISDAYQYGTLPFDSLKTEFLSHYLDVALLKLQLHHVLMDKLGQARLCVASYINGMGSWEVSFLLQKYEQLLANMDIPHKLHPKQGYIEAEAYGLHELLQGEVGIHLFYRPHQNPIPVLVSLGEIQEEAPGRVVRAYHGRDTLTDLRTGYSNALNITANEFKLLLYAGLPPELKSLIEPMGR